MSDTYIIAEAACEHLGEIGRAKQLIDLAVNANADCVKFQCFSPATASDGNRALRTILDACYLTPATLRELKYYAESYRIDFLVSAFSKNDLYIIRDLGCHAVKIPSGRSADPKLVMSALDLFKKVYCSTGMLTGAEVCRFDTYSSRLKLMHCVSAYPVPTGSTALSEFMSDNRYRGYSHHNKDLHPVIAAAAIGHFRDEFCIEVHTKLDDEGPDTAVSWSEKEFSGLVRSVRWLDREFDACRMDTLPCENAILWRRQCRSDS